MSAQITKARDIVTQKVQKYSEMATKQLTKMQEKITQIETKIKDMRAKLNAEIDAYQAQIDKMIDDTQAAANKQFDGAQASANAAIDGAQVSANEADFAVPEEGAGSGVSDELKNAISAAAVAAVSGISTGAKSKDQIQAELDAKVSEMTEKLTNFDFSLKDLKNAFDVQSALKDTEIGKMVEKFEKMIKEAMAIYEEAKAMIDAVIKAIRDIENRVKELWKRVQDEAKKILKEIVDDFIDDAKKKVMSAVPDIDKMESVALNSRAHLFKTVKENMPRLKRHLQYLITCSLSLSHCL